MSHSPFWPSLLPAPLSPLSFRPIAWGLDSCPTGTASACLPMRLKIEVLQGHRVDRALGLPCTAVPQCGLHATFTLWTKERGERLNVSIHGAACRVGDKYHSDQKNRLSDSHSSRPSVQDGLLDCWTAARPFSCLTPFPGTKYAVQSPPTRAQWPKFIPAQ